MPLPDYQELEDALTGDQGAAAETHGTLCGLLCTASDDLPESWIRNTLADSAGDVALVDDETNAQLKSLYEATLDALQGEDMSFAPFLPDDGAEISLRADAIGRWCQGFLYGLAVRGLRKFDDLPADIRELLEDFSEISRASYDAGDDEQEAEAALTEVVEYARVGVQLIFDQLNPPMPKRTIDSQ